MTVKLLTFNSCKTEFLLIGLKNQLVELHNSSLDTSHSTRNLGFIFDEHLTFSDQITALSKACYYHIRQLRCIRPYLDLSTACTIATSIVHSKLDYCNSLYYELPKSQLSCLQEIQNSLTRIFITSSTLNVLVVLALHPSLLLPWCSVLFFSFAVLCLRVGHTMDVLSPFVCVFCHSDWLFHRESCPRIDVHPGRAWLACTWHCSLHYLFFQATPLFPHGVAIVLASLLWQCLTVPFLLQLC